MKQIFLLTASLSAAVLAFGTTSLPAQECATCADAAASAAPAGQWVSLFNGKDFSGWIVRGGKAPFTIENGEIVGTVIAGTPNTFLCTEKNYGDFVLELEFNCHIDVNSGVQIRSEYNEKRRQVENLQPLPGKARLPKDGKYYSGPNHVSGYQVEIEFKPGRTAGIYDEDRRHGWVYPAQGTEQDEAFRKQGLDPAVVKPGQWQKLRIEAQGDILRTYLDGVLRTDARDTASASGLIGLQIHSASKRDNGKQIRFRNIRIKEGKDSGISAAAK